MNSALDTLSALLETARHHGADSADAVLFETTDVSMSQRLGKPEGLERSENRAVGLRAFVGKQQAVVSSNDMLPDTLSELAARAVAMAKAAPADPDSGLAPADLYPTSIPDLELYDPKEPSSEWLAEQCRRAEESARAVKGITNSEGADAHYSKSTIALAIASSKGITFAQSYPSSHFSVSVSVLAGSGTNMERDYEFTSAHHVSDLEDAEKVGTAAAERALKRLNPRRIATCRVPIIFDPRISKGLVGTLANAVSGAAIARGSSFLKDAMGSPVFSKHVTIMDDPHIKRGHASKPFDGEGVRNSKRALVETGVLKSWLLDIRTANKLKLQTTGHATRGIASSPSPSSTNLYMQPGTMSVSELLKDTGTGFYVTETFGMGINTVTGDYSQGAAGFWIENGEIAWPVSEITIAGSLKDMFASITPANDLVFRYGTNAPTLRVESMTVAGT
jgi:PmbA protein